MTSKLTGFSLAKGRNTFGVFPAEISATSPFSSPAEGRLGMHFTELQGRESPATVTLRERVAALHIPPSPASLSSTSVAQRIEAISVADRLFNATANVKILTSRVAMHLDREWRNRLFQQLDSLHDPEEWDDDDKPLQQESFATFLKAICEIRPTVRPGLGLSNSGQLVAAWTKGRKRLTIEFMANDRVRWVVSRYPDDELEQFAGQVQVSRLLEGLKPYTPEEWLFQC